MPPLEYFFSTRYVNIPPSLFPPGQRCPHLGCKKFYVRIVFLEEHITKEHSMLDIFCHRPDIPPQYRCPHLGCKKFYVRIVVLQKHITKEHPMLDIFCDRPDFLPHSCPHPGCGRSYSQLSSMRSHYERDQRRCFSCGKVLETAVLLGVHRPECGSAAMPSLHALGHKPLHPPPPRTYSEAVDSQRSTVGCILCPIRHGSIEELKRHVDVNHKELDYSEVSWEVWSLFCDQEETS